MNAIKLLSCAAIAFSLVSCKTTIDGASLAEVNGEWNIVEINGRPVTAEKYPFIGIDAENKRVYGYSGCNRITGGIELNDKTGKIELGQMASTMMACPNMELERSVLDALASVNSIKCSGKDVLTLYDEDKRPAVLLKKRFTEIPVADLQGEWRIAKIYGQSVPSGGETPNLVFDIEARKVSGHTGCNRLMGGFKTDEANKKAISFPGVATTRMSCPDMTTENNILSALKGVRSFGRLENGNVALYSAGGDQIMELMRNR